MSASRLATLLLGAAAVLAFGIWLGGHPEHVPQPLRDVLVEEDVSLQAEASSTIEDNFYRKVSSTKLRNASIRGMVRSLRSRFSDYFTPKQKQLFDETTEGQFSGVGMSVLEAKRGLRVAGVYPGSPAKRAGIEPGDLITAVNGKSIAGEPSSISTARIKGPAGTSVTLTVRSGGKSRDVEIKRARIEVPVVGGRLRKTEGLKLGLIGIASFTGGVHGQVREQVERLQRRGAEGLVLDLRGNGGGLLDEAVLVSSVFIPDGKIVTTEGRTKPKQVFEATGDAATRKPVVVLVDRGTASAAEIVTAALNQRLDSTIVGTRTFGKGVFGELFELSNGGALDLVVGNYYTPDGSNINGKGIKPDVRLSEAVNSNPEKAVDRALEVLAGEVRSDQRSR